MKIFRLFSFFIGTLCIVLFMPGCKKAYDFIKHHPDGLVDCQVNEIDYHFDDGDYKAVFSYNQHGDPVGIVHPGKQFPLDLNRYFKYDKYNRLIGYMQTYGAGPGFIFWDKYTYINSNTIIDSTFLYGDGWPNQPVNYSYVSSVVKLELDNLGRIVKAGPDKYAYDANGNLILTGFKYQYDNKINIRRTNDVWMFIDRNYSINNIKSGTGGAYSSSGLPLKLIPENPADKNVNLFLGLYYFDGGNVTYNCGEGNTGK